MNYWIITDPHFGHHILATSNYRPADFEERIIDFVCANVKEDDVLICLGDVSFGPKQHVYHERLRENCKGKMWLALGNHDSHSIPWYLKYGWDFVAREFMIEMYGHKILFSHMPQEENDSWTLNIHGHFHDFPKEKWESELVKVLSDRHYLLALEKTKYRGLSLKKIVRDHDRKLITQTRS